MIEIKYAREAKNIRKLDHTFTSYDKSDMARNLNQ